MDVPLEEGRGLLGVWGQQGAVHHHQGQVRLLHPGEERLRLTWELIVRVRVRVRLTLTLERSV